MDDRKVQEEAANQRQQEVVREARRTRARLEEALDRLELELRNVRQVAREYNEEHGVPERRKPWWQW